MTDNDDSATLTDSRDNNTYTVKKLLDGHCWMTENLRLAGGITLTPDNSDVDEYIALPTEEETGTDFSVYDDWRLMDSANSSHPEYGYYYNWYTATATSGIQSMTEGEAQYSICPSGWGLPTGGSSGDFPILYIQYYTTYDLMTNGAPSYVVTGYRVGIITSIYDQGYYWSSTPQGNDMPDRARFLRINGSASSVYMSDAVKAYGFAVRCLVR